MTLQGWVSLLTLIFLEMVLGIDNLVFIACTTDRLPDNKKVLGRRFGLVAALVMRVTLLSLGFIIIRLIDPLFTLPFTIPGTDPAITAKDLILFAGGLYLVVKGIDELKHKISLRDEMAACGHPDAIPGRIGLLRAIGTIAVMDIVFSLDSVITALGMSGDLIIMILAVMIAVIMMIILANPISEFINNNPEIKILALVFIVAIGVKLIVESLGVEIVVEGTHVEVVDVMLYFAMAFSLLLTGLQMWYHRRLARMQAEFAEFQDIDQPNNPELNSETPSVQKD
jgi:predicted tellurium resistance membrane protein TerC